jgi:hypothetical protein
MLFLTTTTTTTLQQSVAKHHLVLGRFYLSLFLAKRNNVGNFKEGCSRVYYIDE